MPETTSKRVPSLRPGERVYVAVINDVLTLISPSRLKKDASLRAVAEPMRVEDWPEAGMDGYRLLTSAGWIFDLSPRAAAAVVTRG